MVMMLRLQSTLLFGLWLWLTPALASPRIDTLSDRNDVASNPKPRATGDEFWPRRGMQAMTVVGDYVYFEGGQIFRYDDPGDVEDGVDQTVPFNNTLSISLKESWSNGTVEFNNITKGDGAPPPSDQVGLWSDPEGKKFYRWGGGAPDPEVAQPDDARLWVFTPDVDGSGEWSTQEPDDSDFFGDLVQGTDGGWTSCNGRGFWVGGYGNERTDARFDNTSNSVYPPIPGYLTYDMESRTWSNDTILRISPNYGTYMTGEAVCLPKLGRGGLVMMLGGKNAKPNNTADSEYFNLRRMFFIDPISKTEHYQNIDGDVPDDREHFCAVTARSTIGSYEIWIYGGRDSNGVKSDVWVLSLPAFKWFNIGIESEARMLHNCALVGKRQALVTGGINKERTWSTSDPWRHSLGIFDMTTLEWSSSFNANADDYESPQVVQDWYNSGGLDKVQWSSEVVRSLFVNSMENGAPENGTDPGGDDRSSNVGVIAGATVGGVAGVVIIVVGAWYFVRRRASSARETKGKTKGDTDHLQQNNEATAPYYKPSPYSNYSSSPYSQPPYSQPPYAQPQYGQPQYPQPPYLNGAPQELDTSTIRHELPGQNQRSELGT